jgi:hypothetical protein
MIGYPGKAGLKSVWYEAKLAIITAFYKVRKKSPLIKRWI